MTKNKQISSLKPVEHIQALHSSFSTTYKQLKAKQGQRFTFVHNEKKMCFMLLEGKCDIKRYGDALIVCAIESPSIVGLSDLIPDPSNLFVQSTSTIEYLYLPLDDVLQYVEKQNLWKNVSYCLMYVSSRFNIYFKTNSGISTYQLICNLLNDLSEEEFETRATVSAAKYILDRAPISRSCVMKILSSLNKGGYIVIKRGLLIRKNVLPEQY